MGIYRNVVAGVYSIKNNINLDEYIGSSKSIIRRFDMHRSLLNRGMHSNKALQKAFNDYGMSGLSFNILHPCLDGQQIEIEQLYFDIYNPTYNIQKVAGSPIGNSNRTGKIVSQEARDKISKKLKYNKANNIISTRTLEQKEKTRLYTEQYRKKRKELGFKRTK